MAHWKLVEFNAKFFPFCPNMKCMGSQELFEEWLFHPWNSSYLSFVKIKKKIRKKRKDYPFFEIANFAVLLLHTLTSSLYLLRKQIFPTFVLPT